MRTKRTLLNMAYALGSSLLLLLLGLVKRRLLVDNFGPQITTASQVVGQLFNFFSIAEFGVGSVISYRLYEQIAAKNEEKISKYMSMYKWAYRVVGLVIAGLALIGAAALMRPSKSVADMELKSLKKKFKDKKWSFQAKPGRKDLPGMLALPHSRYCADYSP